MASFGAAADAVVAVDAEASVGLETSLDEGVLVGRPNFGLSAGAAIDFG